MTREHSCCCVHQARKHKMPWSFIAALGVVVVLGAAVSTVKPHSPASTATVPHTAVLLGPTLAPHGFTLTMGAVTWSCTTMDDVVSCVVPDVSRFRA